MLSNKLKQDKRIKKVKKAMAKEERNSRRGKHEKVIRGKSKFSNKYKDRIKSIRQADEKARTKTQKEREMKNKTSAQSNTKNKKNIKK